MLVFNNVLFFMILVSAWAVLRTARAIYFRKVSAGRELAVNLLFFYLCYVISLTFFPFTYIFYSYGRSANFIPLVRTITMVQNVLMLDEADAMVKQVAINLVGNLLLLAPLGFFLPVLFENTRKVWKAALLCFAVTLSIELAQLSLAVRVFDVDDLLFNTLGGLLGYSIFRLVYLIPPAAALVNRTSRAGRKGQRRAVVGFGLAALLIFLSIFTVQVFEETQTIAAAAHEMAANGHELLGMTRYDGFVSLFSQSQAGEKSVDIYLQVFLDRYTLFSTQTDLQDLQVDTYSLSVASKGPRQDYFIIARSRQDVSEMVYQDQRYPVTSFGEYHFSAAGEALTFRGYFDTFYFLNTQGAILNISPQN